MEEFFSNIPLKRILAALFIGGLVFYGFFKESFLMNKQEREYVNKLGNLTNGKLSGRTVMAVFYFILALIGLGLGYLFYGNS